MDACAAMGDTDASIRASAATGKHNWPRTVRMRERHDALSGILLVGIRFLFERIQVRALDDRDGSRLFWSAPFPSPGCWYLVGELASRAIPQTRSVANPTGIDRPEGPTATGGLGATIGRNGGLGHVTSGGVRSVAF